MIELAGRWPENATDPDRTLEVARSVGAHWVAVDGYHFDLTYQKTVRRAGFKLLCVDDYNHLPEYEADILLNQNISTSSLDYRLNPGARQMLGTEFALLRREFRQLVPGERVHRRAARNLLVTLGGSDPANATTKILHGLKSIDIAGLHAKVVVGAANPHRRDIAHAAAHCDHRVEVLDSRIDMPDLMLWADAALISGGSTCWELLYLGVPSLVVVLAENQEGIARGLAQHGAGVSLGWASGLADPAMRTVERVLLDQDIRERLDAQGRALVDGQGASRIVAAMRGEQ